MFENSQGVSGCVDDPNKKMSNWKVNEIQEPLAIRADIGAKESDLCSEIYTSYSAYCMLYSGATPHLKVLDSFLFDVVNFPAAFSVCERQHF